MLVKQANSLFVLIICTSALTAGAFIPIKIMILPVKEIKANFADGSIT
jgi:hypothetical protein